MNRMKVFNAKKHAMRRGDEELMQTVGEGKDVMSVLCERSCLFSRLPLLIVYEQCERTCSLQRKTDYPMMSYLHRWRTWVLCLHCVCIHS